MKELTLSTHVPFQITILTKTLLANIAFVRFLVRVNTLVPFQSTRITKTLLAHITLVRFLDRVNAHASNQTGWFCKHLLALPSLSLRSFSKRSSVLFVSVRSPHPRQVFANRAQHLIGSSSSSPPLSSLFSTSPFKTVLSHFPLV